MDRLGRPATERRTAMWVGRIFSFRVLLPGRGRERSEPDADAAARRAVHANAVLWRDQDDRLAGQARSCGQCETRTTTAASDGPGSHLREAAVVGSSSGTSRLPLSAAGFGDEKPNACWATDITYIRLRQGFVYLVAIMDWYSRYVLSWEVSINMETSFCLTALDWALKKAKPEIFNSDQGAQFTSQAFTNRLSGRGIAISMDGQGRALDNVFVERLWRTVKYEEVFLNDYMDVGEAIAGLGKYFRFYNRERSHQALGYRTPEEVYFSRARKACGK